MKKKLLLFACLLLTGIGAWADGTDVTASYIGDLAAIVNGSHTHTAGTDNHKKANGIGWWNDQAIPSGWHAFVAPGTSGTGESWTPGIGGAGTMMGRTMVLPVGKYTLKFSAFGVTAGNASDATAATAGDVVAYCTGMDNVDITNTTVADATFHEVTFNLDITTPNTAIDFGIKKLTDSSKPDWCQIKDVTLTLNSTDITPIANTTTDGWTQTFSSGSTGALACNTWSTEGQRDGSDFLVPFIQVWASSGNALSNQTIENSYTPTTSGVYKVSAWVRAYNESGGAISGAKIYVGDVESDACGGAAITNGTLGSYSAMADGVAGTPIKYGLKIEDAAINWISFKNFTITYLPEGIPAAEITALTDQVPTGKMNATIQSTLDGYVSDLTNNKSVTAYNTLAAYIPTAQTSVNIYTSIAAINTKAAALDAAGVASYALTLTAYNEGTLTTVAEAQTAYETAVKAQTTPGAKMTDAVTDVKEWTLQNTLGTGEYFRWDTWSDANGMSSKNYMEYWHSSGTTLSNNKIYTTVTGLHTGYYVVNLEIAANNEQDNVAATGVTFTAGGASNDLSTYNSLSNYKGHVGTYGVMFQVTADNTDVEIALNTTSTTCNWLSFRNPALTYLGTSVGDLTSGDYTVKSQNDTYVKRGGDDSQEAILASSGLALTAATTDGITKFTFADGTADENYLFGSTKSIYTNGTDKEKKGSTTYAVTNVDAGKYIFNIQKGKYFAAGIGAESGVAAVVYSDSPYAWTLAELGDLTAVTGKMSKDVSEAQTSAVNAYTTTKNAANYSAAVKAIDAATASVAAYTALKAELDNANYNDRSATFTTEFTYRATAAAGYENETLTTDEANKNATEMINEYRAYLRTIIGNYGTATAYVTNPHITTAVAWNGTVEGWEYTTEARNHGTLSSANNMDIPSSVLMFENWKGGGLTEGDMKQTVNNLPNGKYFVKMVAFTRKAGTNDYIYIKSGDATATAPTLKAETQFLNITDPIEVTNGTVEIGLHIGSGSDWAGLGNVELYAYSEEGVSRTTATSKHGTICMPYNFTAVKAKLYTIDKIDGNDITLTEVGTTGVAGTPYIYFAEDDAQNFAYTSGNLVSTPTEPSTTDFKFYGCFTKTQVPVSTTTSTSYVLQTQKDASDNDVQGFYKVADGTTVYSGANKCYLTVPVSGAREAYFFGEGEETAISAVNALLNGDAKIYDLNGRQLQKLQKGINIVNGKKIIVK